MKLGSMNRRSTLPSQLGCFICAYFRVSLSLQLPADAPQATTSLMSLILQIGSARGLDFVVLNIPYKCSLFDERLNLFRRLFLRLLCGQHIAAFDIVMASTSLISSEFAFVAARRITIVSGTAIKLLVSQYAKAESQYIYRCIHWMCFSDFRLEAEHSLVPQFRPSCSRSCIMIVLLDMNIGILVLLMHEYNVTLGNCEGKSIRTVNKSAMLSYHT